MIVAFTGHRPDKLGGYKLPNPTYQFVCQQIEQALKELQPEKVISGMALGVDQWAANIAHKLGIPFIAAVPFTGQEKAWPAPSQKTFNTLIKLASEVVIVSEGGYAAYKMQIRNEWMVDRCDKLIAIWDGTPGGTGNCVKYAQSKNKEIFYINPRLDEK
jgi:uncharacterized phage-like protein YoqJ